MDAGDAQALTSMEASASIHQAKRREYVVYSTYFAGSDGGVINSVNAWHPLYQ